MAAVENVAEVSARLNQYARIERDRLEQTFQDLARVSTVPASTFDEVAQCLRNRDRAQTRYNLLVELHRDLCEPDP